VPQLVYGQHFVAFFEILGFSNIVSADMTDSEAVERIRHFDDALRYCREHYGKRWSWEPGEFSVKMFSDCICVSVPADIKNIDAFFQILTYLQAIYSLNDIALRGGVTVGRHYINEQMIFSEALVEAYELEHATKQPRIVVSDKLRAFVMDDLSTNDRRIAASLFQNAYVQKDPEDGRLFLDYLNFMPAAKDNGDMLRRHRDWVVKNLAEQPGHVRAKYVWLSDYHNRWCNKYEADWRDLAELLVPTD
jgi:hypothetical protein